MLDLFKDPKFLEEYITSDKYKKVRAKYENYYIKNNITPQPILFSKFRMYSEIGERPSYEMAYVQHEARLYANAYMAIIYGDDKYIRELEDALYDIMDMYVWALPAHIPDINEENDTELDLCSTAMGSALATIYYLIGDKLHPLIRKRIVTELRHRILEPFKAHIWHWEDRYNNWTAVCAGNVGTTLMLVFPEEFDALSDRFALNMKKYLQGFGDDGACTEGPGYYGYGFSNFLIYALLVREYTNGKTDYFKLEKVKKISTFLQKTFLCEDVNTTFGDCGSEIKTTEVLPYIVKSIYKDEIDFPKKERMCCAVSPLLAIFYYIEFYNPEFTAHKLKPAEYYMENQGWYIKRTRSYALGAKGGNNGESHNHNDVGSFIFAKENKQILCDMGARQYTKDFFTDKRYNYLETSSRGHNVPIINGQYQANVRDTNSYTSLENGVFRVDYKELYDIKELKMLVREFCCLDNEVKITDKFSIEGKASFTERFVSFDEPVIKDGEIDLDKGVKIIFDRNEGKASYTVEEHLIKEVISTGERIACPVYCIDIDVKNPENGIFNFKIEA